MVAAAQTAAGVHGEPRETRDADLAVTSVSAEVARQALAALGVNVAIAFSGLRFGGLMISRVALVGGGQLDTVDLVTPRSPGYAARMMSRV